MGILTLNFVSEPFTDTNKKAVQKKMKLAVVMMMLLFAVALGKEIPSEQDEAIIDTEWRMVEEIENRLNTNGNANNANGKRCQSVNNTCRKNAECCSGYCSF